MFEVKIVPVDEVAALLHVDPMKVKSGILNGTMPIGAVFTSGGRDRTVIIEERLIAWLTAADLKRS